VIWSFIQVFGRQGVNFIFFAALVASLTPAEFGTASVIVVFGGLIQSLSELGFSAAVVQNNRLDSRHYSTIFFINLFIGTSLAALVFFFAGIISVFFKTEDVILPLKVLSIGFLINSGSLTHVAMLQRAMRFSDLAKRDIYAATLGALAGGFSLLVDMGVWAVVVQLLTSHVVGAIAIWKVSGWRPRHSEYSVGLLGDLWPYSSKIFATTILNFGIKNTDRILVGGTLGPQALGIYSFAYTIVILPVNSMNAAIGNYMFAKYSQMQEYVTEVRWSFLNISRAAIFILAPIAVIVSQTAHLAVNLFLDDSWSDAIPTIQVLCALAVVGSFVAPSGQLMKSFGRSDWLLLWSVFTASLSGISVFLGVNTIGLLGASLGLVLAAVVSIPVIFKINRKLIGVTVGDTVGAVWPVGVAAAAMLLTLLLFKTLVSSTLISIALATVMAFAVFLLLVVCLDKAALCTVRLLLSGERRVAYLISSFVNHRSSGFHRGL
jgi:teichuronic acid exporter